MFKQSFKYYKSKNPPPNFEYVLDVNRPENFEQIVKRKIHLSDQLCLNLPFGLNSSTIWEVFEIRTCPGLVFIKNPFTAVGQRIFTIKCLRSYSRKPNKRNIDSLNILSDNDDWWEISKKNYQLLRKLRWATLGYHHNWDTKIYNEMDKGKFPEDLKCITEYIALALGYLHFTPEAAIVNYYHMDSTLSGHTDHSEQNLTAPLFSFSFGQTAIFLIGGQTLEEKPTPLLLQSGDIVVMSEESRLAYHGVPRILKADVEPWNNSLDLEDSCCNHNYNYQIYADEMDTCRNTSLWQPFGDYLSHSRININVRQVLDYVDKGVN